MHIFFLTQFKCFCFFLIKNKIKRSWVPWLRFGVSCKIFICLFSVRDTCLQKEKVSLPAEPNKHLVAMLLCINFQYTWNLFPKKAHKTPNIISYDLYSFHLLLLLLLFLYLLFCDTTCRLSALDLWPYCLHKNWIFLVSLAGLACILLSTFT